jgi:hypothetical protein
MSNNILVLNFPLERRLTVLLQKLVYKLETKDVIFHVKVEMLSVKLANGALNLQLLVKFGKKLSLNSKL